MKKILFPAFVIVVISSFSSCDKNDDEPKTCPQNVASIAATYKLTSKRFKPSGGTESEIIGSLPACERDNLLVSNSNATFAYQDAGVICTPPINFAGDWSVSGSTLTLETQAGTIVSFDCTNLVFYVNNQPGAGDRTTYTYTKQ